jgi:transcriptional regulator with XRE-family HTH domain
MMNITSTSTSIPTLVLNTDPQSSAAARGSRLMVLRHMARLTRKQFAEKHGISANTIQSWESGKYGGLTPRGVQRLLPILHVEGIFCTAEWLLHGVGQPPQLTNSQFMGVRETPAVYEFSTPAADNDDADANATITQELLTFRSVNPNTVDLIVTDDGMEPRYKKGDYVAGIRRTGGEIRYLGGVDCIVQTSNNEVLLRRLKHNRKAGFYDLVCLNPDTEVAISTLYAQLLVCAAPVIWHRCRDIWPK